ncbi:MAG: integrase, partial [Lutibacter sp.]|nr:integrase [Lutibacter sp.]
MAKIKFHLQSTNNPANIYARLSIGRTKVLRRKSGYIINPKDWSKDTSFPKPNDVELKSLKTELRDLATNIEKQLNQATGKGIDITGDWLQQQIDIFQSKVKTTDNDRLTN